MKLSESTMNTIQILFQSVPFWNPLAHLINFKNNDDIIKYNRKRSISDWYER